MDEVFVLRYIPHEVVTWILCARKIKFLKDLTLWIAKKYLIHRCYEFCPSKNIGCNFMQLAAYKALNEHDYTIVGTDSCETEITESVSGIIALLNQSSTCVIGASYQIRDLTEEMCKKCFVNWTECSPCTHILILLSDCVPSLFFFKKVVPLMTMTNMKVVIFGKIKKSLFMTDLSKVQVNGKNFFRVIQ